jgi:small subunit ribosomal protein S2
MTTELIKSLLEAGVHFGHQTKRWNPKMKKFIFGDRGGIYIIDLEKTVECLHQARDFARDIAAKGGRFLYIGTKKQAQDVIKDEAIRAGMFYANNRWMGGLLTNFDTVKKSIRKLQDIERMEKEGIFEKLSKKEVASLNKERERLLNDLGGIREMTQMPQAVVVVDVKKEDIAIKEAVRLKIPIIAMIDTNSDPDPVDYPVPSNDDAVKSIRILITMITDGIIEGRKEYMTHSEPATKPVAEAAAAQPEPAAEETKVVEIDTTVIPKVLAESLSEELDDFEEVVKTDDATTADNKKRSVKKMPGEKE